MAIFKDVVINIQRLTAALAAPNYGLCLCVTTEATTAYKEYGSLSSVAADFTADTQAYKMASAIFSQDPPTDKVAIVGIEEVNDFQDVIDGLNIVLATNDAFTFIVSNVTEDIKITQLAQWATANKKFYGTCITPSMIDSFQNPESDYVVVMVHDVKGSYPEAALIGRCSTFRPGSATWMFKTLNGIQPVQFDDQATTVGIINGHKYMTYVSKHGINMTTGGFVSSGEYVDVMLGVLWMQNDMELRIQRLLVTTPKVPYDNGGIALIAAQVDGTLRQATTNGIIRKNEGGLGEYSIFVPDIANINPNDIANRELNDITFTAYLAGAIHHVEVNGVVQY